MAYPIIRVNSSTGSDVNTSGAGPNTALKGTNASTSANGLSVILPPGTVFPGVAVDGSHCFFLDDATPGARNFSRITTWSGAGGGSPTVQVSDAFGFSLSGKNWAIGGRRATLNGSKKLYDKGGADGDVMPGWVVEMESGYTESIGSIIYCRRAANSTDGLITLRGVGPIQPVLTFSANDHGIIPSSPGWRFENFEIASSSVKGSSCAIVCFGVNDLMFDRLKIKTAGVNCWGNGILNPMGGTIISECEIANISTYGIRPYLGQSIGGLKITGCYIHDINSIGIHLEAAAYYGVTISDCIIKACAQDAIRYENTLTNDTGSGFSIQRCVLHSNGFAGIRIMHANDSLYGNLIENVIITNNGFYGIRFENAAATVPYLTSRLFTVRNCNFYQNTSGKYFPLGLKSDNEQTFDPQFVNDDFTVNSQLSNLGFPSGNNITIGAKQRQASLVSGGFTGGFQ